MIKKHRCPIWLISISWNSVWMNVTKFTKFQLRLAQRTVFIVVVFIWHYVIKVFKFVRFFILYRIKGRIIKSSSTWRSCIVYFIFDFIILLRCQRFNSRKPLLVLSLHVLGILCLRFLRLYFNIVANLNALAFYYVFKIFNTLFQNCMFKLLFTGHFINLFFQRIKIPPFFNSIKPYLINFNFKLRFMTLQTLLFQFLINNLFFR